MALARSTAVLHAAEAIGPAVVLLLAGRSSGQATAPTNPH
jgi:hypothetical protein